MHDPELVWRFGRFIARRGSGIARLSWSDGEVTLRLQRGQVVTVEGPEPVEVGRRLGLRSAGKDELLAEARAVAELSGRPETQVLAVVKELLQEVLAAWLLDPGRDLELEEGASNGEAGATISATHAIVELILADDRSDFESLILPELDVLLRRSPDFLELYSPLRLSEEADLVVAKITGQRTATEIAARSPHGSGEVGRLLAALVATGMLEPVPLAAAEREPDLLNIELPGEEEPERRPLPVWWILAVAAAAVVLLAVLVVVLLPDDDVSTPATGSEAWGLVVDMGCEPEELQRVLRKARQHSDVLRPVRTDTGEGSPCWRLVWGRFPTREAAERQAPDIPETLVLSGFTPHPVELPEGGAEDLPE